MLFTKLSKLFFHRKFPCTSLCTQFRKFNCSVFCKVEARQDLESIQYEDLRLQKYLKSLQNQYETAQYDEKVMHNYKYLRNIVSLVQDINMVQNESNELSSFISELQGKDEEILATAKTEMIELQEKLNTLKSTVLQYLIPDEIVDDNDIIMELSCGVGGQEAMLFTKDMFNMYCNFVQYKGWSFELLRYDETDIGGLRNGHIAISGKNAYKTLKYECGVHRVQRIPKTEKSGRIHTSTMTVAVLPQPSDIDIIIKPQDIELEFKRSSGAGGQHVNTTDSCVRILHKSTGIVVESQVERDQHRNREIAMKSLRAKLYERELECVMKQTTSSRKLQIGTASRSEKVRTYNFVQDRITDHRAHLHFYDIDSFFSGDELLNKLLDSLQSWNSIRMLKEILKQYESTRK